MARNDRIDRPRIRDEKPQAPVMGPRAFTGADFTHFPRLVVQIGGRPRPPRAAVGGVAHARETPEHSEPAQGTPTPPADASAEPSEGFAHPIAGMGAHLYEGLRQQLSPQLEAYRTAVHGAYADQNLTDEERKGLRQQRRDIRQDVRQYKTQHPLQMGLGQKIGLQKQTGTQGTTGTNATWTWPHGVQMPSQLRSLFDQLHQGHITPEQALQMLQGGQHG